MVGQKLLHTALAVVALTSLAADAGHANTTWPPAGEDRHVSFTVSEGTRMSPDVSPDGRTIVFDLLGTIYVVPAEGGAARALTDDWTVNYRPRFSPDGKRIAYLSDASGTLNIRVMNADGSGARMISEQEPGQVPKDIRFFITPEWTADGRHVAAAVTSDLTYYGSDDIRLFPVDGGESVSVLNPPPLGIDRPVRTASRAPFAGEGVEPAFTPDGRTMFYSARTGVGRFDGEYLLPRYQVARVDLATGARHIVTDRQMGAFSPAVSPDGRYLVYATRDGGNTALRIRDLARGGDRWLLPEVERDAVEHWHTEGLANGISFFPDSRHIVTSFDGKLQKVDVETGTATVIPFEAKVERRMGPLVRSPLKLDDGPVRVRHIEDPELSPDGRTLAFAAHNRIWLRSEGVDQTPRRLTGAGDDMELHPAWSPDGRQVAYAVARPDGSGGGIKVAGMGGAAGARAIIEDGHQYARPTFTPDGRHIIAVRRTFADGLAMADPQASMIVEVEIASGRVRELMPITEGASHARPQVIAADPGRVYVYSADAGIMSISRSEPADLRLEATIGGLGLKQQSAAGPDIADVRLRSDGRAILIEDHAMDFPQVYVADADLVGTDGVVQLRQGDDGVRRLTDAKGGLFPFWTPEGEARFMLADTVFGADGAAAQPLYPVGLAMPRATAPAAVALLNGRVITMEGADAAASVIARGDILLVNGRIAAVGESGSIAIPDGAVRIDVTGKTVIPGLIDSHSHEPGGDLAPDYPLQWSMASRLAYGVTTVLDPSAPVSLFKLRDMVETGDALGPRILTTGPIVSPLNGMRTPEDAAAIVSRHKDYYGTSWIKSYDVGGRENRQMILKAVQDAGINTLIETDGSLNYSLSIILDGYFHLAHGIAQPVYEDFVRLMAASGSGFDYQFLTLRGEGGPSSVFWFLDNAFDPEDPKFKRFYPAHMVDARRRRLTLMDSEHVFEPFGPGIARLMDAGVPIGLGDHSTMYGLGMHWEMWSLAAGAGAARALRAATIGNARMIGLEGEIGSIAPGKAADLVVLNSDPLENIRNTADIRYVVRAGHVHDANTLEQIAPLKQPPPQTWWTGK